MSSMAADPLLSPRTESTQADEALGGLGVALRNRLEGYAWSTVAVALATVVGIGMASFMALPNVSMVFLLAVVFSATVFGIWPALLTSVLSFLAYNFFFIEPHYTLSVSQSLSPMSCLRFSSS